MRIPQSQICLFLLCDSWTKCTQLLKRVYPNIVERIKETKGKEKEQRTLESEAERTI